MYIRILAVSHPGNPVNFPADQVEVASERLAVQEHTDVLRVAGILRQDW